MRTNVIVKFITTDLDVKWHSISTNMDVDVQLLHFMDLLLHIFDSR